MYSLVYSNNIRYKLYRHSLFWAAWLTYFITIYSLRPGSSMIGYGRFLQYSIIETLILMSIDIVFCYSVMYLLVSKYLIRGKYLLFFFFILLFMLIDISVSQFFYLQFINPLRQHFDLPQWKKITFRELIGGMSGVLMVTGIATTIRFIKLWHLKEQEYQLLKSEKISTELKSVDTYIQPNFLPQLLKKIYSFSLSAPHKVPEMLDYLQKIMSYLINECNSSTVLISHELDAISNFLNLEKLTNHGRLLINYDLNIAPDKKKIVPFILFPLIENNFRQVNDNITDNHSVNINLTLNDFVLSLEIMNSKPVETSNLMSYETTNLQQIRKRLELLYPESHKLNILIEQEVFTIKLEITLNRAAVES